MRCLKDSAIYILYPLFAIMFSFIIPSNRDYSEIYTCSLFLLMVYFTLFSFYCRRIRRSDILNVFLVVYISLAGILFFNPDFAFSINFIVVVFFILWLISILDFIFRKNRSFVRVINLISLSAVTLLSVLFLIVFIISNKHNLGYILLNAYNLSSLSLNNYSFSMEDYIRFNEQIYANKISFYINWLMSFGYSIWVLGHIFVIIFHENRVKDV